MKVLQDTIAKAGGQAALAAALKVKQQNVWNWLNRDKRVPAEYCPTIERLYGVPCEELRPDVEWQALRVPRSIAEQRDVGQPAAGGLSEGQIHA